MKTKIYGFNNGGPHGWQHALAVSEHGDILCSHLCSSEIYMPADLGMVPNRTWKHDVYNKSCPDGWETEFVYMDQIDKHEGLQRALKLAREKDAKLAPENAPSVTITFVDDKGEEHTRKELL